VPVAGGAPRRICSGCPAIWGPDGTFLYLGVRGVSRESAGKTLAIPLPAGEMLPELPALGIVDLDDETAFPGSRLIDGYLISPGPDSSTFAYTKSTMHRNLFRITWP
jgi:hypothetical protein